MSTNYKQLHAIVTVFSFFAFVLFFYEYYSTQDLRNTLIDKENEKLYNTKLHRLRLQELDTKIMKVHTGYTDEKNIQNSIKQLLLENGNN